MCLFNGRRAEEDADFFLCVIITNFADVNPTFQFIMESNRKIHRFMLSAMASLTALSAFGVDNEPSKQINLPDVYGTIRLRSEYSTEKGEARFMVRTARVGILGDVGHFIEYKAELDVCDRGEVKVTDVWGRFNLPAGFKIQIGQMRMPFTFGSGRAPHTYLFADRPYVDKQFIGPRNVGVKGIFNHHASGVTVEAGVFNSTSNTSHATWQSRMQAAAKVQWRISKFTLLGGYETLAPTLCRTSNWNAGLNWKGRRLTLEGEYVYKHYNGGGFDDAHAYNFTVDYKIPLRKSVFNNVSVQGRFDGMTDYSSATQLTGDGHIAMTEPTHQRLTVGATLSYVRKNFFTDIKLNYANYFYHSGYTATADKNNKLTAEIVIHF